MSEHSATGGIEVLQGMDAIRRRPQVYVGPLDAPLLPNILLREALCCARDEALQGKCRQVSVTLLDRGIATVRDDGPGLPLTLGPCGRRTAEIYLTELHACASGKSSKEFALSTCDLSLAVLNALCSTLRLRIFADGSEWCQHYEYGVAKDSLQIVGESKETGTELSFQLDATLLTAIEYDFGEFASWAGENVKELAVYLFDTRTGELAVIDR